MRALLTGGAGYVGSACLRAMLEGGHEVVAYDDLSAGNAAAVPDGRLIEGDIRDVDALAQAIRDAGADVVMHFAALASVPESIDEPERYWDVNVRGTQCVLDAMRTAGADKLIFSSTAATYAFTDQMPLDEDSPQVPETPYGTTKLACEQMIRDYAVAHDLGAAIIRYFNASGADPSGEHGECRQHETHLIPLVLAAATGVRPSITVFGDDWPTRDGTCVRDYVHVWDLASAHELAVGGLRPGTVDAYTAGTGAGTTVMEVIQACEAVAGRLIPVERAGRRPGDPAILVASPDRLVSRLGWTPRYSDIRSIVETAWRWHESHPQGYVAESARR